MFFYILGGVLALAAGLYIGFGMPGFPGAEDRVVWSGRRRRPVRRPYKPLNWLKPPKV